MLNSEILTGFGLLAVQQLYGKVGLQQQVHVPKFAAIQVRQLVTGSGDGLQQKPHMHYAR